MWRGRRPWAERRRRILEARERHLAALGHVETSTTLAALVVEAASAHATPHAPTRLPLALLLLPRGSTQSDESENASPGPATGASAGAFQLLSARWTTWVRTNGPSRARTEASTLVAAAGPPAVAAAACNGKLDPARPVCGAA